MNYVEEIKFDKHRYFYSLIRVRETKKRRCLGKCGKYITTSNAGIRFCSDCRPAYTKSSRMAGNRQ